MKNKNNAQDTFNPAIAEREIEDFDIKSAKQEKASKIISRVFSAILGASILAFVIFLCVRIYQSDYKAMNGLYITKDFSQAYQVSQDIYTHDTESAFMNSDHGSLFPYSLYYIKGSGYLQICVRYNKNQIKSVQEQCPNFTEDKISFNIVDSQGNVFTPSIYLSEDHFNYKYFKLEFTGIDFTTDHLLLNMILNDVEWVKETDTTPAYLRDKVGSKYALGDLKIHETYKVETDTAGNEVKVEKEYLPYTLSDYEKSQVEEFNK
ncbi:MAG: hypothetical protein IJ004_05695 [Clostridia bacterium]|nr:hypothetical protein [Clostridia bacterium]